MVLTLGVLLPTSGISLFAAHTIDNEARRSVMSAAGETARALRLVADREVAYRAGVLKTLAASPALDRGDFAAFYEQARAIAPDAENAVILSDLSGRQILNTRAPFSPEGLGPSPITLPHGASAAEGGAVVSGVYVSPLARRQSFSVWVPVVRGGKVRMHVSMGSFSSQLQRIFEQQELPNTWIGTLVDADGRVLARNRDYDKMAGKSASSTMLAALAERRHGHVEAVTLDGIPVLTTFDRASDSGWSMLIAVPREDLRRPALEALRTMLLISLAMWAVALLAALKLGRAIAGPVASLKADAETLGAGGVVAPTPTGLAETDVVQGLLATASRDLRNAEETLQQRVAAAVAEAERAQRAALSAQKLEALGRLTGGIAHDFNNLLQTMSSGVGLAARLATDPRAEKSLAACDRAISKAVKLTRQLMSFGRAQPGHRETFDIARQFESLGELLRGAVREGVTVTLEAGSPLSPVTVDPVQFELAVLNLALNSRDAMGGHGTVAVRAADRTVGANDVAGLLPGRYVEVTVTDTGHGIPPELLPRVFEPFFTTKPMGEGTGLGLAQVYAFAVQSGGTALVNSTAGSGTTVTLLLPATWPLAASEPPAAAAQGASLTADRYSGTVLLVEDDALVRGITAQALEDMGFSVLVASGARDAQAIALSREDIDIVLSDVMMPGDMSGVDLVHALREARPRLPVILVSGYAAVLDADLPARTIAKPYKVDEVARLLDQTIRAGQTP